MRISGRRRAAGGLAVLALAGCGSASRYDSHQVARAFAAHGLPLHRLPSRGAEQPAMGETSACATRFASATPTGAVVVTVCDDAGSVDVGAGDGVVRRNVVVEYAGHDGRTQRRIAAALDDLG